MERQQLQKTVKTYKEEHKAEALRIRQEIARYVATATEPAAAPQAIKPVEDTPPIAVQLAEIETKIALLSGDLSMLQSALESNLLSDEMRARLRRIVEKTLETLHIKTSEEKNSQEKRQEKEIAEKQAQLNVYIQRYADLQVKREEETRKTEANRQFYAVVMNMGYGLNGVPRWPISVMSPPPEKRLNEKTFTATLRQQDNRTLAKPVLAAWSRPPLDPPTAVPALRASVLQVKELLLRGGGIRPDGGGMRNIKPEQIKVAKASVKFNAQRRPQ
jgi:hypothetical protein